MDDKIQKELLDKIEDISVRKEVSELYRQVFAKLSEYQEEQLARIYQQVEEELTGNGADYTIVFLLCKSGDTFRFREGFEPLLQTGRKKAAWGNGAIGRIFIGAENAFLERLTDKKRVYPAVVQTNYETYKVSVVLRRVTEEAEQVQRINRLLLLNGVDMPEVNDTFVRKFYDVCFYEVNDRLRQDEEIEGIQVEWGALQPYIREEVSLLWNVKKVTLKENAFPAAVNLIQEVRYDHELLLPHKESAYVVELPEGERCQVFPADTSIRIRDSRKEYRNWEAYEIIPAVLAETGQEACRVMTNGIKKDIFTGLKSCRSLYTRCELYRIASSYDAASLFDRIAVEENGELLFYPKEPDNYLNADAAAYILKDMSAFYGGRRLEGRLVEDEE